MGLENHLRMVVFCYDQMLDQILGKMDVWHRYKNLDFYPGADVPSGGI